MVCINILIGSLTNVKSSGYATGVGIERQGKNIMFLFVRAGSQEMSIQKVLGLLGKNAKNAVQRGIRKAVLGVPRRIGRGIDNLANRGLTLQIGVS